GPYQMDWREFMPIILEYAVYMGFMHRSERTVHEQILFRLDSKSRPVKYHDIVEGAVVDRDAAEIKKNIHEATASLQAMGARPGDRIALVGLNSTRYLVMDIAIGLVGAVSVPLYYTCPPSDIEGILEDCKARMLLVGAPGLLDRVKDLPSDIPVVSFCRGPVPDTIAGKVIGWEAFLDLGRGGASIKTAPIGFGDVATIRYTSSTTGKPKGVVFKHEGLRWMAESLASLPPWDARNSLVTYLSFLPMNHVVEGILGTYSPYYAPAPLDIWFLENFRDLQRSLPLARPTIFFSVPRFYEKVLEGLQENNSYRRFKAMRAGIRKGILRGIIRRAVLKRVGLDRCAQLIVGSAPCSDDLLRDLRDLGIEVHNAYGLTEAPLVTLNRLGRNRIGTVGEPLLETNVGIAKDGEVLVNGPQVMAGYLGGSDQPFRDGWLLTGDYGSMTPEGSLIIHGRKKELIVTSYGKNIYPMKIETMLEDIPGVVEAMVVGEGRPYCCAIIWVERDIGDDVSITKIDKGIESVNDRLSGPERLKRWAILANDLSIEGGLLTANLKLKRQKALERLSDVVTALYGEKEAPGAVLHIGATGRGT
ncbi:MAG: AMP-binding protein, partial [Methanomassiliicoccales archaeon]|nr:AMP-binding protein [Methanomassiliicoccales archaeon]